MKQFDKMTIVIFLTMSISLLAGIVLADYKTNNAHRIARIAPKAWGPFNEEISYGAKLYKVGEAIDFNNIELTKINLPVMGKGEKLVVAVSSDPNSFIAIVFQFGEIGTVKLNEFFGRVNYGLTYPTTTD